MYLYEHNYCTEQVRRPDDGPGHHGRARGRCLPGWALAIHLANRSEPATGRAGHESEHPP
eukprot:COSAG03_NODE_20696_length_315_cov_0.833333_1_plen_59_part_10